ncbi:MAG: phosphoribosylamine--glycine ligase [Desulfobacteraceae bacterium]|nr:phosphoribosylamine--glycine ligase [Desulfobacteraceae bacterium]
MKILVVGAGGREHALVWKLKQSPLVKQIYCAPGNAGIAQMAQCVPIDAGDVENLLSFARSEKIDLTIVGPEEALSKAIVDVFQQEDLRIFGPEKKSAAIEASKSFAKYIMNKYGVPTAAGQTFTEYKKAQAYIEKMGAPVVVKADGLAAGKGVLVCDTVPKAIEALNNILVKKEFGQAGAQVVIEEFLEGEEASFIAFTDGKTVLPLPSSQDHKPVFDDDKGLNTGGMGAYSPAPVVDKYLHNRIMEEVMIPTVRGMAAEGRPYKGMLYAGLMINRDQIKVLEFNGRFGDPEAQPLLMRLKNDIVPVFEAVIDERLEQIKLDIDPRAAVCVVMASGGYPGKYKKQIPINGLNNVARMKDVMVFHAGTDKKEDQVVTAGGRVLGVTALGDTVEQAIDKAYKAAANITWKNVHYRKDIGKKALDRFQVKPKVGIVMGSDSDLGVMEGTVAILKKFGIAFEMTVASAHRSPEKAARFATGAKERGIKAIIAGAGSAAHLAGSIAAQTTLPVIGVPIDSSSLQGLDALLSTVQMPAGIPVATVAIGKAGAKNAGILAAQIIALDDTCVAALLDAYKIEMAEQVERKAKKLEAYR